MNLQHMLLAALSGGGLVALVMAPLCAKIIKTIKAVDAKISNPVAQALVVDGEEEFFAALRSHIADVNALANKFGVPPALVVAGIKSLLDAETANPFTRPEPQSPAAPVSPAPAQFQAPAQPSAPLMPSVVAPSVAAPVVPVTLQPPVLPNIPAFTPIVPSGGTIGGGTIPTP